MKLNVESHSQYLRTMMVMTNIDTNPVQSKNTITE